ncbi:MAG: altronate dehydratase, partial [Opitutae bacterium]|nr:altronate dehydratase [Opitutae bacterium]
MSNDHDRKSVLQVSPEDNLLVALRDLGEGEQVEWGKDALTVAEEIPAKHKLTTSDLSEGDPVYMYGVLVGEATKPISRGKRVSTANLVHRSAEYQQGQSVDLWTPPSIERWKDGTFEGFHRKDGSVGTANHWLVLPMVFCENGNVETLKNSMLEALGFERRNQYQR